MERRLIFVTGKGGVGKTTVAAALARRLAARGRRVLLAPIAPGTLPPPSPGVTLMPVDGADALTEYLGLVLPDAIVARVSASLTYQRFVAAAPGLRELMALGKVAHEARSGAWDHVIVDAPATGHLVELLRMPAAAAETFAGRVHREAERLLDELRNPEQTAFVIVTLAEALAVNETVALAGALADLRLPLAQIVVNRLATAPVSPEELAGDHPALACGREQARWARVAARNLERVQLVAERPLLTLPLYFPPDLDVIGAALVGP